MNARRISFAFVAAVALPVFGHPLTEAELSYLGTTYFAPLSVPASSVWRMRAPDGEIRQFDCPGMNGSQVLSSDGWTAEVRRLDAAVKTPPGQKPALTIFYSNGIPVAAEIDGGGRQAVPRRERVSYGKSSPPKVRWPARLRKLWKTESRPLFDRDWKWVEEGTGRLRLWFDGPNQAGALFAMLFSLALVLAIRAKGAVWRLQGILLSLVSLAALLRTQSRGALVAAFAVGCVLAVCHLHVRGILTRRRLGLLVLALVLAGGLAAGVFAAVNRTRDYSHSNEDRLAIWRLFPRIMADAPQGWGAGRSGAAYADWYSPSRDWRYMKNLVGDHITALADFGWLGGGLYLFVWLGGLFGLFRLAWKGGTPVPLAVWSVLGITSFFNAILPARTVLVLPLVSLVPLAFDRRWCSRRFWGLPLALGAGGACACLLAVYGASCFCEVFPSVRREGNAILVKGERPAHWIVVDFDVLGSPYMYRSEIREAFQANPSLAPVGVVGALDDVPRKGVQRLVLSGRHCAEFLKRHRADGFLRGVPPEIVFLSPGFSASAVPLELHARSRVSLVMGEFAARYYPDMANPPKWVRLAKGAEVYVMGWMRYAVPWK